MLDSPYTTKCRHCGSQDIIVSKTITKVFCGSCGASGPEHGLATIAARLRAWNHTIPKVGDEQCPFCGSRNHRTEGNQEVCRECGAAGPRVPEEQKHIMSPEGLWRYRRIEETPATFSLVLWEVQTGFRQQWETMIAQEFGPLTDAERYILETHGITHLRAARYYKERQALKLAQEEAKKPFFKRLFGKKATQPTRPQPTPGNYQATFAAMERQVHTQA